MSHTKEVILCNSIYIIFKTMAKPICDVKVKIAVAWEQGSD